MKRIRSSFIILFLIVFQFSFVIPALKVSAAAPSTASITTAVKNYIINPGKLNAQRGVIVKYRDKSTKAAEAKQYGLGYQGDTAIEKISANSTEELQKKIDTLKNDPSVEYVQPNYLYKKFDTPSLSKSASISSVSNDKYSNLQWYLNDLQINNAWSLSTGQNVLVAVIDTGIDYNHEDLAGRVIGGQDFTGTGSYMDNNGHGTHVAGIIAANKDNGVGVAGIAYNAKLLAVKVLDSNGEGDTYSISQGIRWAADNGAKVLNMSLGSPDNDPAMEDAVAYAQSKGCIIVAATGNDGLGTISYPAAYNDVIAVGATNEANQLAEFSNFGPQVSVVAPGVDILSTVPSSIDSDKYVYMSGTSMSSALVSGEIALLFGETPSLTLNDIKQKLSSDSFNYNKISRNDSYGYGLLDINLALGGGNSTLNPPFNVAVDDNAVSYAKEINAPTSLSENLACDYDINWYKVKVPANSTLDMKISSTQIQGLKFQVYHDNFTQNINNVTDVSSLNNGDYQVTNNGSDTYYYVSIYDDSISNVNFNLVFSNSSVTYPSTSIKDSTLLYSIDSLREGQVVSSNTLTVSGWALSKSSIAKLAVTVDGLVQNTQYGLSRPDVYNAFKDYGNMYAGFNSSIDLSKFSYGKHYLGLTVTEPNGVVTTNTLSFQTVDSLKYYIDNPSSGQSVNGDMVVSGWALSKANITKVEAIIDGTAYAAQYGLSRPDVYNAFKDYNNQNSGYSLTISKSTLGYGNHSLVLRITDGRGTINTSAPLNFSVQNTLKYYIDNPTNGQIAQNTLNVSGWALSKDGINKAEILVDGISYDAQYGLSRPDVYNAFKDYNNKNSGYAAAIDTSKLAYGDHSLILKITDGRGVIKTSAPLSFKIQNTLIYYIDSPVSGQRAQSTLNVSGWALSKDGIKRVEALIDGTAQDIQYGVSRSDVLNAFRDYGNANSGFASVIDTSKLSYGNHSLAIRITDGRGITSTSAPISFNIQNTLIYYIDSPVSGITAQNLLNVSGWAISKDGINKVDILIDGASQSASYGTARPDVYNAFKDYGNQNSGYTASIDTSKLAYGTHSLAVRITDNRGISTTSTAISFNIQNTLRYYIDNPFTGEKVQNTLNLSGWAISKDGINKIEALIDGVSQDVQYGISRPDVYNAFKDYDNKNSGFTSVIDISSQAIGNHNLRLKITDGRGMITYTNSVTFNKVN